MHPAGSTARLALALLMFTGQRKSDVIAFGRQHFVDEFDSVTGETLRWLHFTQAKNRNRKAVTLDLPVLPKLMAAFSKGPTGNSLFSSTSSGDPLLSRALATACANGATRRLKALLVPRAAKSGGVYRRREWRHRATANGHFRMVRPRSGGPLHPKGRPEASSRRRDASQSSRSRKSPASITIRKPNVSRRNKWRWRPRPESNRGARICSPLRNHSATRPRLRRRRPGARRL